MGRAPMDWTTLQVLVEVARSGSLAEAARSMDLAAPTVRRRLDALEIACGFTLFTKGPLGLKPTAVGRRLLTHAAEAEQAALAATRLLHAAGRRVTVAAMELITERVFAPAAQEILDACPDAVITFESHRTRESLTTSTADIVILASPLPPGAEAVRIGDMEIGLYAHKDYLEAAGGLQSPADLARRRIIGARSQAATPFILGRLGLADNPPTFSFLSDSTLAQARAMAAGGGVTAYYTDLAAREPDLVRVLPDTVAMFEICLWWPGSGNRPAVAIVSDVVRRVMRRHVTDRPAPDSPLPASVAG